MKNLSNLILFSYLVLFSLVSSIKLESKRNSWLQKNELETGKSLLQKNELENEKVEKKKNGILFWLQKNKVENEKVEKNEKNGQIYWLQKNEVENGKYFLHHRSH